MTLAEAVDGIAAALTPVAAAIPGLNVYTYPPDIATTPCLDFYPDDPFQEGAGFGVASVKLRFIVRARVQTTDTQNAYQLLYRLLDPSGPASVEAALANGDAATLESGGNVSGISQDPEDVADQVWNAKWRVSTYL